jgi:predicted Rossmann fold nucleotide-binding protein DprA/Smf involved in DNA uptake
MAVPGRADDPLSDGPLGLLKDGAAPVCSSDDILRALGLAGMVESKSGSELDRQKTDPVMRALEPGPRLPEDLANVTGLPLSRVLSELSKLEVEGLVIRDEGGQFLLK